MLLWSYNFRLHQLYFLFYCQLLPSERLTTTFKSIYLIMAISSCYYIFLSSTSLTHTCCNNTTWVACIIEKQLQYEIPPLPPHLLQLFVKSTLYSSCQSPWQAKLQTRSATSRELKLTLLPTFLTRTGCHEHHHLLKRPTMHDIQVLALK